MERAPLFIVCQNPACAQLRQVNKPSIQRRQRYCGRRCAAIMHNNVTTESARKGGLERGRRLRARIRQSVETMTPLEAFRYGYTLGLKSKTRQLLKLRKRAA